jgi:hypothetical protein
MSETNRPIPPPERELAMIEGACELLLNSKCRHCAGEVVVISRWPTEPWWPRAVEVRHERGCPDAVDTPGS